MTHRDLEPLPAPARAEPEHRYATHFRLGSDIEEVCQLFLEQRQSIGRGLTDAHFELEERKILRIRAVLLDLDCPADLALRIEKILPDLLLRDEVTARGLSLDDLMTRSSEVVQKIEPLMYEVREALPEAGAAWYDLGVMVSRLSMCLSYLDAWRDQPRDPAVRDPWDVYTRELGHVSGVLRRMIATRGHDTEPAAASDAARMVDALEPYLQAPDPASTDWCAAVTAILDAIFVDHGVSTVSVTQLADPTDAVDTGPQESTEDPNEWLLAERERLVALMEDDATAAHAGLTELHRTVRDVRSPADLVTLHLEVDLCAVKARLGQPGLAADLLHDVATTTAFHHGPRTVDTAAVQVRVLSVLLQVSGRPEATAFRDEHLAWLTTLPAGADPDLHEIALSIQRFDRAGHDTTLEAFQAMVYQGRFAEAETGLRRLLADLPTEDPAILPLRCRTRNALAVAVVCQDGGRRSKEATTLALRATQDCELQFGPQHPTTTAVQVETVFALLFAVRRRRFHNFVTDRLGWLLASDPATLPPAQRTAYDRLQDILSGRAVGLEP